MVIGDIWHIVHCFAVPEDATAFAERFGGVPFDPAKRGAAGIGFFATQPRGDGERPYYRRALFAPHADAAPIAYRVKEG